MHWLWLAFALGFVACHASLPSSEPLGTGPKASRGDGGASEIARAGGAIPDAGSKAAPPSQAASEARTPPPVSAEADASDAGASDAAVASSGGADAGDAGSSAAASLAGMYHGWDTTTYKLPNVPESPERDQNARTRVVLGSGDAIELVVINSATGQDLCVLKGKLKSGNVTLDKGQSCFEESDGKVSATLSRGSARFSGKHLVLDAYFDLEVDTGEDVIEGELVYHFEGDRK